MPEDKLDRSVIAVVSGRVQGVGFRASTRQMAARLGLSGWVRNLPDGRVEALFQGPDLAVEKALDFIRVGPSHARVDAVEIDSAPAPDESPNQPGFQIR